MKTIQLLFVSAIFSCLFFNVNASVLLVPNWKSVLLPLYKNAFSVELIPIVKPLLVVSEFCSIIPSNVLLSDFEIDKVAPLYVKLVSAY